ncbi:hypothetical protein Syun_021391 [Stephania yunnanensis]|uniref:Uncharacterized protein n=1 Tax=Stephania yunnanensis TaxID=152371 RepID=A0AAP0NQM5_9MAGN
MRGVGGEDDVEGVEGEGVCNSERGRGGGGGGQRGGRDFDERGALGEPEDFEKEAGEWGRWQRRPARE